MHSETVKLVDGTEIQVQCRMINPRKAYALVREILKVTEMVPTVLVMENDGKKQSKEGFSMKGDFSGFAEIVPRCIDQVVLPCPQRDEISIPEMRRLYKKYAEETIKEVMADVSPKL
jgi:hypothetical protein